MLRPAYKIQTAGGLSAAQGPSLRPNYRPLAPSFRADYASLMPTPQAQINHFSQFIYRAFCALILLRMLLADTLMNRIMNYSDEGGSIIEKIHPATYGMFALLFVALITSRVTWIKGQFQLIRQLFVLLGVIFGLIIWVQIQGRSVSMGFLLETYIASCLICILALTMTDEQRYRVGCIIVIFGIINAAISVLEKIGSFRVLPYIYEEISFRPTAITAHPLHLGLLLSLTSVFVFATRWNGWIKAAALVTITMGVFASGARTAMIFTVIAITAGLIMTKMPGENPEGRFRLRLLQIVGVLFGAPIILIGASMAGFLERFEGGYIDENAQARVDVYKVFDWVSPEQILFGADMIMIKKLVFDRLNLLIESSVVVFIFQFGLIGAVIFAAAILWTFYRFAAGGDKRSFISIIAFFGPAMSNDTMSGKHHYVLLPLLLILCFRRDTLNAAGQPVGLKWDEKP